MRETKTNSAVSANAVRWVLILCGVALVVWQFFTFMDVVQMHTAQAQSVSRSASWSGKPVGTTPQIPVAVEAHWSGATPASEVQTGMIRAVAP